MTENNNNKRDKNQIAIDKEFITKLLAKGIYTHQEITDKINERYKKLKVPIKLTRQAISLDIKNIRLELIEDSKDQLDGLRQEKILHFQHTKRIAIEAYHKTVTEHIKRLKKEGSSAKFGDYYEEGTETERMYGNPKFLDIANKCDIEIAKLQFLYEKSAVEDTLNTNYQDSIAEAVALARKEFLNE